MTTPCSVPGRSALVSPSPGGWPEPGVRVPRRVHAGSGTWWALSTGTRLRRAVWRTRWPGPHRRTAAGAARPVPLDAHPGPTPEAVAGPVLVPGGLVRGSCGSTGSGWTATGRWPGTPPAPRSAVPTPRSRHRRVRSWGGLASGQRAVGRELPQQRGEFSLNIDHPPGGPQLAPQPLVLLTQPRILPIPRIGRRPTHRRLD